MTPAEKCRLKLHMLSLKIRIFYNKMLMFFYLVCRNCVSSYFKFIKYCLGVSNE